MFLSALLKMVMEKKNAMKRDLLCGMVVWAEYRECIIRDLIAVALRVFLHFGIYWVMPKWVVGLLWCMKNRVLVGMEVAFFGLEVCKRDPDPTI